jgi:hypothetical protein
MSLVGDWLKFKGKKTTDLIKDLGIDPSTAYFYARADRKLQDKTEKILAEYFGVSIEDFRKGVSSKKIDNPEENINNDIESNNLININKNDFLLTEIFRLTCQINNIDILSRIKEYVEFEISKEEKSKKKIIQG